MVKLICSRDVVRVLSKAMPINYADYSTQMAVILESSVDFVVTFVDERSVMIDKEETKESVKQEFIGQLTVTVERLASVSFDVLDNIRAKNNGKAILSDVIVVRSNGTVLSNLDRDTFHSIPLAFMFEVNFEQRKVISFFTTAVYEDEVELPVHADPDFFSKN